MEDFNVKVTSETENKEAQELFFNLGASWCYGKHINENIPSDRDIILHNFGSQLFWAHTYETENFKDSEEITLQELRDMVKPKVKEYLDPDNGYDFIKWTGFAHPPESFIEVPEGANVYARCNIFGDYKWLPKIIDGDWSVLWQREKETLSDKVATAEVARQEEKHSHYKKDVSHLNVIDPYRIADLYDLHPCADHIMKKSLCAGNRGHKDALRDIQDIIDTAERWKQMIEEDNSEI